MLSKPISRLRLFLTKYATGLVFTGLQTVVFSVGCFFVFGARAGVWAPGVLWAVPFLVLFYSYLFAISTLVGMITRSAMTAIITTMLIWFLVFLLNSADAVVLQFKVINELQQETQVSRIERLERTARAGWAKDREEKGLAVQEPTGVEIDALNPKIPELRKDLDESRANGKTLGMVNTGLVIAKTVCPKTGETMEMLKRRFGDLLPEALDEGESETFKGPGDLSPKQRREVQRRVDAALSARGPAWILGTSLGFEVVVLGIAGWLFCRRDF